MPVETGRKGTASFWTSQEDAKRLTELYRTTVALLEAGSKGYCDLVLQGDRISRPRIVLRLYVLNWAIKKTVFAWLVP
jgi:hypothetical protein